MDVEWESMWAETNTRMTMDVRQEQTWVDINTSLAMDAAQESMWGMAMDVGYRKGGWNQTRVRLWMLDRSKRG